MARRTLHPPPQVSSSQASVYIFSGNGFTFGQIIYNSDTTNSWCTKGTASLSNAWEVGEVTDILVDSGIRVSDANTSCWRCGNGLANGLKDNISIMLKAIVI